MYLGFDLSIKDGANLSLKFKNPLKKLIFTPFSFLQYKKFYINI